MLEGILPASLEESFCTRSFAIYGGNDQNSITQENCYLKDDEYIVFVNCWFHEEVEDNPVILPANKL